MMMGSIHIKEEEFLAEHFRYYSRNDGKILEVIRGEDLQTKKGVQQTLDGMHIFMQSESLLTTASLLSKRYGYYIATVPLALITIFNKSPNMSPNNTELVRMDENLKWFPKFRLLSKDVSEPKGKTREEWMREELEILFKFHVHPFFLHINQLTRLSMDVMWENIAIYIFWFYERQLQEWYDADTVKVMKHDFKLIVNQLPGEVFGTTTNPFSYFQDQPLLPTEARKRKCCCLSYKLYDESIYCKVCPHLIK